VSDWSAHGVRVAGTTLAAWLRRGTGPAVVFEAGLGLPGASWRPVADRLPADRAAMYYDRAGLGRSDPGTEPRTGSQQVRELDELLDVIDLAPPYVLVGHSAGAFVVRLYALRYPERVAGIVLVDPSHEGERSTRWVDTAVSLARPAPDTPPAPRHPG
jgi:pimeloyl-ACP methyl ester carboxylesterase